MSSYYMKNKMGIGEFIPQNPKKYVGKYPIIVRSSWERMFFQWLDLTPSIVEWANENVTIKYFDPISQKTRRYYPDAYVKVKTNNGYEKYIVEVKPEKEIRMPKRRGKKSEKTIRIREQTFITNKAKFGAAQKYCEKLGMKFKILTERELFGK